MFQIYVCMFSKGSVEITIIDDRDKIIWSNISIDKASKSCLIKIGKRMFPYIPIEVRRESNWIIRNGIYKSFMERNGSFVPDRIFSAGAFDQDQIEWLIMGIKSNQ